MDAAGHLDGQLLGDPVLNIKIPPALVLDRDISVALLGRTQFHFYLCALHHLNCVTCQYGKMVVFDQKGGEICLSTQTLQAAYFFVSLGWVRQVDLGGCQIPLHEEEGQERVQFGPGHPGQLAASTAPVPMYLMCNCIDTSAEGLQGFALVLHSLDNLFLYKPKLFYKGTKMNYAGLSKTKDRADLIAWLRTKSDSPVALP